MLECTPPPPPDYRSQPCVLQPDAGDLTLPLASYGWAWTCLGAASRALPRADCSQPASGTRAVPHALAPVGLGGWERSLNPGILICRPLAWPRPSMCAHIHVGLQMVTRLTH